MWPQQQNPGGWPQGPGGPGGAPVAGSMGLGFAAGFFGGCIGLILVLIIAKGPLTKKGAGFGFGAAIVLGIILNVIVAASR